MAQRNWEKFSVAEEEEGGRRGSKGLSSQGFALTFGIVFDPGG